MSEEAARELWGIKQVAQCTGLPPSTIRYYDAQFADLLGIERGAGRRRLFPEAAVDRLRHLHHLLRDEGLSLRQARQALAGGGIPAPAGGDELRAEVNRLRAEVEALKHQLAELRDIQARTLALVGGLAR